MPDALEVLAPLLRPLLVTLPERVPVVALLVVAVPLEEDPLLWRTVPPVVPVVLVVPVVPVTRPVLLPEVVVPP